MKSHKKKNKHEASPPNIFAPTVIVILGATGDLMSRKIAPALFTLYQAKMLPKRWQVLGFADQNLTDKTFQELTEKRLKRIVDIKNDKDCRDFIDNLAYQPGKFESISSWQKLDKRLKAIHDKWGMCGNTLFYLAVPPQFYSLIFRQLAKSGLTKPCSEEEGWTRVIIEKPFGKNEKTAKQLDLMLSKYFREEQIYRVDHYLAKEMLQNILAFRFANNLFEQTWHNKFIEKIEIRLWEKIGVEKRGAFYDGVGALRDVGQNHLLQMLALVTMEQPQAMSAEAIRQERVRLLKQVTIDGEEAKMRSYRAQYEGYQHIDGVLPNTKTETYVKFRAQINNKRWQGVPIVLESGKRMGKALKEIIITFKHPQPCLCADGEHNKTRVVIRMEPKEDILIQFWSKKPGLDFRFEKRNFNFLLRKQSKGTQYIEEYVKLLLDSMLGDQTLFVNTEEVLAMWRIIDDVAKDWRQGAVPLHSYPADTTAPAKQSQHIDVGLHSTNLNREISIVGLGKMGSGLAAQLIKKGWRVAGYNKEKSATDALAKKGLVPAGSLNKLVEKMPSPRVVWLMVPAGKPVDDVLFNKEGLYELLNKGDIIIDGGNSFYKDSIRRAKKLKKKGIEFIDVGVSGGPKGARHGASLMIGGDREIFNKLEYLFNDIAVPGGYEFFTGVGAGHFVKMIHNGIEYGMMQAIAEGFAVLKKSTYDLDLSEVAQIYNNGAVIESKLMGWLENAFKLYGQELKNVTGTVGHSGEAEWTVKTADEIKVETRVIKSALKFRQESAKKPSYTGKILSSLRNQFGGHAIKN